MTEEERVVQEIHMEILKMSPEDQTRVKSIAATLRNAIKAGGYNAQIAFALVGAELAAKP